MAAANTTCSVDICDRQVVAKGYCSTHHRRYLKYGAPYRDCKGCQSPIYETDGRMYCDDSCRRKCSAEGCDDHAWARGLCNPHYSVVVVKGRDADTYQKPSLPKTSYTCIICEKEYGYWGSTKVCSHKCQGLYSRHGLDIPSLDFTCGKCGKHVKRDRFEKHFMSATRTTCDDCFRRPSGRGFYSRFYRSGAGMAENCALCGEYVDRSLKWPHPMSKSVDHIVPLSRGGTDDLENLQLAHLSCNMRKHDRVEGPNEGMLPIM